MHDPGGGRKENCDGFVFRHKPHALVGNALEMAREGEKKKKELIDGNAGECDMRAHLPHSERTDARTHFRTTEGAQFVRVEVDSQSILLSLQHDSLRLCDLVDVLLAEGLG